MKKEIADKILRDIEQGYDFMSVNFQRHGSIFGAVWNLSEIM